MDIKAKITQIIDKMSETELKELLRILVSRPYVERRQYPRKPYAAPLRFSTEDQQYRDSSKDISLGGLLIQTEEPRNSLALGQQLRITIPNPDQTKYLRMRGEIVRITPKEIAVRFIRKADH